MPISVLPIYLKKSELKSPNDPLLKPTVGNGYSDRSALTSSSKKAVLKNWHKNVTMVTLDSYVVSVE